MKFEHWSIPVALFVLLLSDSLPSKAFGADLGLAFSQNLDSLLALQSQSGAFPETQCEDKGMTTNCESEDSIFITALALDAIYSIQPSIQERSKLENSKL